jgi:outer membrane autotransporter protein/uncharacterized repeat protein (TIGR01451 family)
LFGAFVLLLGSLPSLAVAQIAAPEGSTFVDLAAVLDPGTPNPVNSGQTVTWLARVDNVFKTGLNSAGALSVDLSAVSSPAGFSFSASGSNWSCSISTCTYNAVLPAGSSTTDLIISGPAPFAAQSGTISLAITSSVNSPVFFDGNSSNDSDSDEVQIQPLQIGLPDYAIASFSGAPDPVDPGEQASFTLVVFNDLMPNGNDAGADAPEGSGVTVDFSLASAPPGAALGSISGSNWSCGSSSCAYGLALSPGEQAPPLNIAVSAPASGPGSMTLTATLGGDKNQSNNVGQASVAINAPKLIDYRFRSISGSPDPIAPSASGNFELVVEQITPVPLGNTEGGGVGTPLVVSYSLDSNPGGASLLAAASGIDWSCSTNSCTYLGSLAAGLATTPLTIPVQAPPSGPGSMTLSAQISGDDVISNNQGTASIAVLGQIFDLAFAEFSASPATVLANGEIEFLVSMTALDGSGKDGSGTPSGKGTGFSFDLSASSGTTSLLGNPSGSNWSCGSGSCQFLQTLSPGQTTPAVRFLVQAPAQAPSTVKLDGLIFGDDDSSNNSGSASVAVINEPPPDPPQLTLDKQAPAQVEAGQPFDYVLDVANTGSVGASQLQLSDRLPEGVTLIGVSPAGGWFCDASSNVVNCNLDFLAVGQSARVSLSVRIDAPGEYLNEASLDALLLPATLTDRTLTRVAEEPDPRVDLRLVKTDSIDPVAVGASFAYDIEVSNLSSQSATEVTVSDELPAGVTLVSAGGSGWSCSGAVVCVLQEGLLGGQSRSLRIEVTAPANPGVILNQASVSSAEADLNLADNSDSEQTTVTSAGSLAVADLALSAGGAVEAEAGAEFELMAQLRNLGPDDAQGIRLSGALSSPASLISATLGGQPCSASGTQLSCLASALAADASVDLVVRAMAAGNAAGSLQLSVDADSSDPLETNNTASVAYRVDSRVDLRLVKTDSIDPVAVGASFAYDIEVSNLSSQSATEVTVSDELPAGVTLVSAGGSGWSCSGAVVCVLQESLLGGQSRALRIEVTAPMNPGMILNQASVSSAEADLNPADNSDSEQTTVTSAGSLAVADLALSAGGAVEAEVGAEFELMAQLRNLGPDDAQGIRLSGSLSGPASLISASLGGQPCSASGSQLSCLAGGLATSGSVDLVVRALAGNNGAGSLQLSVDAETTDPLESNNLASVVYSIAAVGADLAIEASAGPNPVASGGTLNYQITLRNNGPASATQATLLSTFDAGLQPSSASGAGLNCSTAGNQVNCLLAAPIAAGSSLTVDVAAQVLAAPGATVVSNVSVVSPADPNPGNDSTQISTTVGDRNEDDIRDQLDGAAGDDPTAGAAVGPVAELCANPPPSQVEFCNRLLQASDSEVQTALQATAPEETMSQSVLAREISFAQFFNIDARLAELRGAAGGFSSAGLMLSGSGGSLPLGSLLAGEDAVDDSGGLFGSPWGFFINGTISSGEQDGNARSGQVGVDFDSRGLTAGVDYRFSNALTAGLALGYADFDADISGDSSIDTQGLLLTGYASWYPTESLYLDGRLSFGQIDFEQSRRIRFTLDGQTTDLLARGDADADQFSLAAGIGYHWNFGAWNVTPNGSVRYSDTSVDGFTERGADPFNLRFEASDTDSLQVAAGVQVSRAFSTTRGVLTPQLSLSFNHEDQDEDLTVIARFADGGSEPFRLVTPPTDSSYGALGLGMVYVGPNGVQAYLNYRTVFGYDDFERDTINLGARFEF